MGLEQRLRLIEGKLRLKRRGAKSNPPMTMLDLPKETVIGGFGILKDMGGYQLMYTQEQLAAASKDEIDELNKLTPTQFYELMLMRRSAGAGKCKGESENWFRR